MSLHLDVAKNWSSADQIKLAASHEKLAKVLAPVIFENLAIDLPKLIDVFQKENPSNAASILFHHAWQNKSFCAAVVNYTQGDQNLHHCLSFFSEGHYKASDQDDLREECKTYLIIALEILRYYPTLAAQYSAKQWVQLNNASYILILLTHYPDLVATDGFAKFLVHYLASHKPDLLYDEPDILLHLLDSTKPYRTHFKEKHYQKFFMYCHQQFSNSTEHPKLHRILSLLMPAWSQDYPETYQKSLCDVLTSHANFIKLLRDILTSPSDAHLNFVGEYVFPATVLIAAFYYPHVRKNITSSTLYYFEQSTDYLAHAILSDPELRSRLLPPEEIASIIYRYPALQRYVDGLLALPEQKESELSSPCIITVRCEQPSGIYDFYAAVFHLKSLLLKQPERALLKNVKTIQLSVAKSMFDFRVNIQMQNELLKSIIQVLHALVTTASENGIRIEVSEEIKKEEFLYDLHYSLTKNLICSTNPEDLQNLPTVISIATQKRRKLYINRDATSSSLSANSAMNGDVTYNMIAAAEVLNDVEVTPRIRMSALQYRYDTQSGLLHQDIVNPARYSSPSVSALYPGRITYSPESIITELSTRQDGFCYVLFSQEIFAQEVIRLHSIHPHENIIFVGAEIPDLYVSFENDHFYYVISECPITLNYIVSVKIEYLSNNFYHRIPAHNPIKQIIDFYKNPDNGFTLITDKNKKIPEISETLPFKKWCELLFSYPGAGVCWHRALAVSEKIKQLCGADNVRIIGIDDTHAIIEVRYNGFWYPVELGGGSSTLKYEENESALANEDTISEISESANDSGEELEIEIEIESDAPPRIQQLRIALDKTKSLMPCDSTEKLMETVCDNASQKILIKTDSVDATANALLKAYQDASDQIFYIDSRERLFAAKNRVVLDEAGTPQRIAISALEKFLLSAKDDNNHPAILLLDIRKITLDSKTLVAINTCFDAFNRTILGIKIPDHVRVITLCDQLPDDPSFLSRQNKILAMKSVIAEPFDCAESDFEFVIDLCGYPDWKKALFGRIILENNRMIWLKSKFIVVLTEKRNRTKKYSIILSHYPAEDKKQIAYFLAQSKAQGYFEHQGLRIPIPNNIYFDLNQNDYNFSSVSPVNVVLGATAERFDFKNADIFFINTFTFDRLLHEKRIENGTYTETMGIVEFWQRENQKPLELFITTPLTDAQWWCLFYEAKKYHVSLQLYLAPGVTLPKAVPMHTKQNCAHHDFSCATVLLTDNAKMAAHAVTDALLIPVEDFTFQDLCYRVDFESNPQHFSNFKIIESEVFQALKKGRTVVLYGKFSYDMLCYFQTMLLPNNPYIEINFEPQFFSGKLQLIIERPEATLRNDPLISNFAWLGKISVLHQAVAVQSGPNIIYQEPDNSTLTAEMFISQRKKAIFDALKKHTMIQLVGHTGVGKSRLMKEIKTQHQETCSVYCELTELEQWANDTSQKTKILFIDESNIDNLHYTVFDAFKQNGSRQILYRGKLFQLDKHHKIIFARNPHDYGGGRVQQKLFADHQIPELHFSDFSPDYIYQKILKPIFDAAKLTLSAEAFKEDTLPLITAYLEHNKNTDEKNHITVRELQHQALLYCVQFKKDHPIHAPNYLPARFFTEKQNDPKQAFVLTKSSAFIRSQLNAFLEIKKLQQQRELPDSIGLNGFYIEGEPSAGKSMLVEYTLKKYRCDYIKIEASVPLEQKKELLLNAWETGRGVWIDEINSCSDDGFEKLLNRVLTESSGKPGFFLLATGNSIALEGRAQLSPALKARCVNTILENPTQQDIEKILQTIGDGAIDTTTLAKDFVKLQKENPRQFTLRGLLDALAAVKLLYGHTAPILSCSVTGS